MPRFPHSLPTAPTLSTVTVNGVSVDPKPMARFYARAIGPAYQATDNTVGQADAMAIGAHAAYAQYIATAIVAEAFLDSASYLLEEWENMLGLAFEPALSTAARRTRLVAAWRSLRGGSPQSIKSAIDALLTAPDECSVVENTPAAVTAWPANIFMFAVVVPGNYTYGVPGWLAKAQVVLDKAKPAHTQGNLTNVVGFYCDDAGSLTDLTVLAL